MRKKSLIVMLIISMILFPIFTKRPDSAHANPVLKEAVKWVVKEAIKEETESMTKSMIVKQGVRTTEKSALEKANERWFQRLPSEAATSLQESAARAVPSGTPGWLKTVVGAGMFLTGADLIADIAEVINSDHAGNEVNSIPYWNEVALSDHHYDDRLTYGDPRVTQGGNGQLHFSARGIFDTTLPTYTVGGETFMFGVNEAGSAGGSGVRADYEVIQYGYYNMSFYLDVTGTKVVVRLSFAGDLVGNAIRNNDFKALTIALNGNSPIRMYALIPLDVWGGQVLTVNCIRTIQVFLHLIL